MKDSLLDHVVCPVDSESLKSKATKVNGTEVLEGTLTCAAGHIYSITQGVPRLLSAPGNAAPARQTRDSFSAKWRRIPNFGHEAASREFYINWSLELFGFKSLHGLRDCLSDKRFILDAGTGLGREALLYAENTKGLVFGVEVSDSIDLAYQHVGHVSNIHLIQADLTALPFREPFFDYIASNGVLHHTADTRASFDYLKGFIRPGGQIAVYVYKKKGPIREFCDDFLREHYTNASEEECYAFSRAMTSLGKALFDLKVDVEVPEDIPILDIKAGKQDIQRFIYWNVFKCYWNDELDFETNVMTNFDWYHPQHAHRHTPEEVRGWCAEAGLEIVHFNVIESGISVRARKPSGSK